MNDNKKRYLVRIYWFDKRKRSHRTDKDFAYSLDVEDYLITQHDKRNVYAFHVFDQAKAPRGHVSFRFLERIMGRVNTQRKAEGKIRIGYESVAF